MPGKCTHITFGYVPKERREKEGEKNDKINNNVNKKDYGRWINKEDE